MYYMTHPVHGAMHVYSEQEVEANKVNGWKLVNQDEPPESLPEPVFATPPPPRRGPGRPRKEA